MYIWPTICLRSMSSCFVAFCSILLVVVVDVAVDTVDWRLYERYVL